MQYMKTFDRAILCKIYVTLGAKFLGANMMFYWLLFFITKIIKIAYLNVIIIKVYAEKVSNGINTNSYVLLDSRFHTSSKLFEMK